MNKDEKKIVNITLKILSKKLWKNISVIEVRKKVNLKNELFDKIIKKKSDLLKILNMYFDYCLSLKIKTLEISTEKDMMFELLMMRFDILQINRKSLLSIFNSYKINPMDLITLFPIILDSIILMNKYAKIKDKGLNRQIKIKGYFLVYILSFNSWTKDQSSSLEKTMMDLDSYLNQFDKILKFLK